MTFQLVCVQCEERHDGARYLVSCHRCGGLLDVEYATPVISRAQIPAYTQGIARYLPNLPINDPSNLVTIGEGDIPVVPLSKVGQSLGLDSLYAKLEYLNPTGSFKDRGNAVQVSVLKETGVTEAVELISGNAGHSLAAYCGRAGIRLHGFAASESSSRLKAQATVFHGIQMHWTNGDQQAAEQEASKFSHDSNILYLDCDRNIYFVEGQKTMAYEIADQMDPLPDHVVIPVGNGSILYGLWKGFNELVQRGKLRNLPRLHAVQAEENQPIVAAFEGRPWTPRRKETSIAASGVDVPNPARPDTLVGICRDSGGRAIAVSENKVLLWQRQLAELEGLLVEPTSAISFGAIEALMMREVIREEEAVLVPLTGFGMKEPFPKVDSTD